MAKKTIVISTAFSINMIPQTICETPISFTRISSDEARNLVKNADSILSIVGHPDTAHVFGNILNAEINPNRISFTMDTEYKASNINPHPEETRVLLVGQYTGPRLAEGATTLPEGARIDWWLVDYFWDYDLR